MARRLTRKGGDAQVTPDALLSRRGGAPVSIGAPVSVAKQKGEEIFSLFGSKGIRSVFDELTLEMKPCGAGRSAPRIEWKSKIWTVSSTQKDYPKNGISSTSLFTETRKMGCPSFSIPAGPVYEMGTCPAANHSKKGGLREEGKTFVCDGCVSGDTLVMVKGEGLVRIDEIERRGQEVVVWSGQGWRTTRAKMTSVSPVVEVETNFGFKIRLTDDHLVRMDDGKFVEAGKLKTGDRLSFEPPTEAPFPENKELPVQMKDGQRHHNSVVENFPKEWTYDVGLFLGYILGDGAISYGDYPTINISSSDEDKGDLERIKAFVSTWCSTKSSVKEVVEEPNEICDNPGTGSVIKWRVRGIFEFVDGLGLDKRPKCHDRRVPFSVLQASRDGVRGFLSGLFSSDGSILVNRGDKDKTAVTLASTSLGLLRDVQILLSSFGIRSSICAYKTSNKARVESGYRELWKLDISSISHVEKFRDQIGFFSERKKLRLDEAILSHRVRRPGRSPSPKVSRVISVQGSEPVYDLINVGEEHQFVANGLSVHNCYSLEGNYIFPNVAIAQAARLMWLRRLLESDPTGASLAKAMASAIEDYARNATLSSSPDGLGSRLVLELGVQEQGRLVVPVKLPEIKQTRKMPVATFLPPESGFEDTDAFRRAERVPDGVVTGFFRIHDSGDLGALPEPAMWKAYLQSWVLVAEALPHVLFWAPTRMWMWKGLFKNVALPKNLAIRPSALHVDDEAPRVEGLVAGSAVLTKEQIVRTVSEWSGAAGQLWPCPVYGKEDEKSCIGAGCRACWIWKRTPVAYRWH